MFNATVSNEMVKISGSRDIADLMLSVTMIINAINDSEALPERDRWVFRKYVREELPKIAFMDDRQLEEEGKRIRQEREGIRQEVAHDLAELLKLLREDES